MKNSKKRFFTFVSLAAFLFAMLIGGTNTNANNESVLKVLTIDPYGNYTCIGSGGSCLPVVVIVGDER